MRADAHDLLNSARSVGVSERTVMAKAKKSNESQTPTEASRASPRPLNGKPKRSRRGGASAKNAATKRVPWDFPKHTIEDSIKIAQAIEEKNSGNPLDAPTLAKHVDFRKSNDWRFKDLLRSANQYGLVEGSGEKATVELKKIGTDIVAPGSPQQRKQALASAFENVNLFKKVAEHYAGKTIPEDEYFANTLSRDFNVSRDRLEHFISVFTKNLQYLKAFAASPTGKPVLKSFPDDEVEISLDKPKSPPPPGRESTTREFLDTCFVLMPFGGWYDRYYEELYKQAIKDAGFEPMRADDLFHTGSVMEQIWEQVNKAKVLLAELTGKNANVFYELGLSHARGKPVVFVAGTIEDVPFDLRHLRVITYDVCDPTWGKKLREEITRYLKHAKTDPNKSIPQPYRDLTTEVESPEIEDND